MKLCYFNLLSQIGGAERSLLTMLAAVREADADASLHLICGSEGPLCDEARKIGVDVTIVDMGQRATGIGDSQATGTLGKAVTLIRLMLAIPAYRAGLRRLRACLNALAPDLIHSNNLKTHLMLAQCKYAGAPIVWHLHDYISNRSLIRRLLQRQTRSASHALAVSESVKQDWSRVMPDLAIGALYNAVDIKRFSPQAVDGSFLDRLATTSTGRPVPATLSDPIRIGLVATYAKWKGHDIFIQAAARLPERLGNRNVLFYIVGGPIYATAGSQWSARELSAQITAAGLDQRMRLVPFQADTADVYRALDVVVHASTRPEPFGLTIVEAMACGKAVISAAAGGAAELVENEVSAMTVAPGDIDALSVALARLAGDGSLRERLGGQAVQAVRMRFSPTHLGRALSSLYKGLIARHVRK